MPFVLRHSRHDLSRRGFSILELTIVFGIMGFVLGGIWLANGQMSTQRRVNASVETLGIISERVHSAHMGMGDAISSSWPACPTAFGTNYANKGYFPTGTVNTAGFANHDWSQGTTLASSTIKLSFCNLSATYTRVFVVRFTNVPREACVKLLTLSSSAAEASLKQIVVSASSTTTMTTVPSTTADGTISTTEAVTACATASASTPVTSIDWYYSLR